MLMVVSFGILIILIILIMLYKDNVWRSVFNFGSNFVIRVIGFNIFDKLVYLNFLFVYDW